MSIKTSEAMKATLVIPTANAQVRRFRLVPRMGRRGEVTGFHVSPSTVCRVLNRLRFLDLRDVLGARIETDAPESAAEILRLSTNEPGLVRRA